MINDMIYDPNWLYSTIAQSSAAIVAVVGGFITASVLMLTAEKRNLSNQLNEKKVRYESYKTTADLSIANIVVLQNEIPILEARIKAFSYPPNLMWGVAVLSFLAVFGILFPVILIAYEAFFNWAKVFITATFWLGIIGVFAYITFQIRDLTKK